MTRVDELQSKYPSVPRDVILKHDVSVQGVRDSGDIGKVSEWVPALRGVYRSKDYVGTLREQSEKESGTKRPGYVLRPPYEMRFKSGLGARTRLSSTSPYSIGEVSEGTFTLYEGEERVEGVHFLGYVLSRTGPEPVTSKGTPISQLLDLRPSCFRVFMTRYCQYFSTGEQCLFCNLNASNDDGHSVGLEYPITSNVEETVEAYRIRSSEVRQLEGFFMMGGFAKAEQEAKIFLNFIGKIAAAASYKPSLSAHPQPLDRKDMQRLKDVGLDCLSLQIEVMEPRLFAEICPGKAKHYGYERFREAYCDAVDIFGVGSAGAKLSPGITLLCPNGHTTWEEARDCDIEGNRWLIKNGVVPSFQPMWWAPGSVYGEDRSNLEKFPPTECYLEIALAHHRDMLEFGLYEKMNKFLFCGLDCSTGVYAGDIGMLTLAGDVGKWMSSVVPEEANWLAKFTASIK